MPFQRLSILCQKPYTCQVSPSQTGLVMGLHVKEPRQKLSEKPTPAASQTTTKLVYEARLQLHMLPSAGRIA
ncbi:hypothetical protein J1614_007519 [Plenodomus biglobosus]|nr:hypothetical protein J1614_007519 [Plenodomus biglobosus]